jgi:tRNA-2-methylthio-N6-dimethylallyladenosine synthase
MALVRAVGFASSFSFKYSPRPGTPAADREDQIEEHVKSERLAVLQALLDQQRHAFNAATVGREIDVLFEKLGRHEGQIGGKSPYMQAVHAEGSSEHIGREVRVEIIGAGSNSLSARLMSEEAKA